MADVFISYSRKDEEFVRRLHAALAEAGRESWVDWEGIPPTAKWMDEVRAAIDAANAFVFVVSPDSAASPVCREEVEHAAASGKRFVPVLWRDTDEKTLPEAVSAHNWIFMRDGDDFAKGTATVLTALDTDLDWVRLHTRLVTRAREWEANNRERSFLVRGRDLEAAERSLATGGERDPAPTPLQTQYLYASRRAEQRGQRVRVAALSAGLIGALLLAGFALFQLQDAITQRRIAQARELAASANEQLSRDPELSLLLATRAVELYADPGTDRALRVAIERSRTRGRFPGHAGPVRSLSFSRDGKTILTASDDGTMRLWDVATKSELRTFSPDRGFPFSAALSADGSLAIAGTNEGRLIAWDVATGAVEASIWAHQDRVKEMALSPAGERLATIGADGLVNIWDTSDWTRLSSLPQRQEIDLRAGAFSPDGKALVFGGRGEIVWLYDVASGRQIQQFAGHSGSVQSVAFAPDGMRFASASADSTARIWDVASGAQTAVLRGHEGAVLAVGFDPSGQRVLTTGSDGTIRLWDSSNGVQLEEFAAGSGGIESIAISPDGKTLATGATDGSVRVWAARAIDPILDLDVGGAGTTFDAALSPDGSKLLTASEDGAVRVFDRASGALLQKLRGRAPSNIAFARFDPTGARIVGTTGTIATIWDVASGATVLEVAAAEGTYVQAAAFDVTGSRLVIATSDSLVRIVDSASGTQLVSFTTPDVPVTAAFTADGSHVLTAGEDGTIREWYAASGEQTRSLAGHLSTVQQLTVSHGGSLLASVADDEVRVWDLATGGLIHVLKGEHSNGFRAAFDPGDQMLATGGNDGAAHVWDLATGELIADISAGSGAGSVNSVVFSSDRELLVGAYSVASVYPCALCSPTSEALVLAGQRVTRDLTSDERSVFLHEAPTPAASPAASSGSSPEASQSPGIELTLPPLPTLAADDLCIAGAAGCDGVPVPVGDYRPSRFEPAVTVSVAHDLLTYGQTRGAIFFVRPGTFNQIALLNSDRLFGASGDSSIVLQPGTAGIVQYMRSLAWLSLEIDEKIEFAGRPAIRVRATSDTSLSLGTFNTEPYPLFWTPNEQMTVFAVETAGEAALVIIAEWTGSGDEAEFNTIVDQIVEDLQFR